MALETGDYIDDLVITNPLSSDDPAQADDHMRLIKKAVKQSFPGITGAVTSTHTELNLLDGVTSTTAELNILDGVTSTAAELNILDGVTSTAAELNILDGVTSTAAELNVLDGVSDFLDEDDMSSDSATALASQQSIKAYVDNNKTEDYILIEDHKSSGTAGGGSSTGSFIQRDLNQEVEDTGNNATVASNQVTLLAGTYRFKGSTPAYYSNEHQCQLYNVTDTAVVGYPGTNSFSNIGVTRSECAGRFTITSSKVFQLQQRLGYARATDGLGQPAGWGTEVYSRLEFWKEN